MIVRSVITAGIGAAGSAKYNAKPNQVISVMTQSDGGTLAGVETVIIQYTTDSGTTWRDLKNDGVVKQLSTSDNSISVVGPLVFRAYKSATVASVGVSLVY